MEGHGLMRYKDGSVYEGYFVNGKKHGKGTYVDPNGNTFDGNWRQGKRQGPGKLRLKGATESIHWDWKNDKLLQKQFK